MSHTELIARHNRLHYRDDGESSDLTQCDVLDKVRCKCIVIRLGSQSLITNWRNQSKVFQASPVASCTQCLMLKLILVNAFIYFLVGKWRKKNVQNKDKKAHLTKSVNVSKWLFTCVAEQGVGYTVYLSEKIFLLMIQSPDLCLKEYLSGMFLSVFECRSFCTCIRIRVMTTIGM